MPLFMDRHDLPGVTAEQVAQAHMADLEMGAKFGVQFLAYWFDADQGEAFCLAKAPTGESLTAVHQATHGLIPNEIISVSEDNVLRLLGRMSETGGDTPAVNPFRTILFTDLRGFDVDPGGGRAVGVHGPAHGARPDHPTSARGRTWARGQAHGRRDHGLVRRRGERAGLLDGDPGRIRGTSGGGPDTDLRVRIGIAAGEPVDHNDDLFGSTVTLASRICGAAEAGRILTSEPRSRSGQSARLRVRSGSRRGPEGLLRSDTRVRTCVAGALTRSPNRAGHPAGRFVLRRWRRRPDSNPRWQGHDGALVRLPRAPARRHRGCGAGLLS